MSQRDKDIALFVVWLLNKAAERWGTTASRIYRELQRANLVDDYLIAFYDVLHTMGEQALLDDLATLAVRKGLAL